MHSSTFTSSLFSIFRLTYCLTFLEGKSTSLLPYPSFLRSHPFHISSLHLPKSAHCDSLTPWRPWKCSPGICCWPTALQTNPWSCCFHSSETPSADDRLSPSENSGPARLCPCRTEYHSSGPPDTGKRKKWSVWYFQELFYWSVCQSAAVCDLGWNLFFSINDVGFQCNI